MAKATAIEETVTLYHPHGRFTIDFKMTPINERRRLLSDGKWTAIPGWRLSICGSTPSSGGQNQDELAALARTLKLPASCSSRTISQSTATCTAMLEALSELLLRPEVWISGFLAAVAWAFTTAQHGED